MWQGVIIRWTKRTGAAGSPCFVVFFLHIQVGKVFTINELKRLGDFCKAHDLILLSDEIYHDLILDIDKTPHIPITSLGDPELLKRTIILHAASKTYNIPGLSCAYAVIPGNDHHPEGYTCMPVMVMTSYVFQCPFLCHLHTYIDRLGT